MHVFVYQISTEDLCIKSLNRHQITLLLQWQLFVFILLFYFILRYSFIFMLICINNISNCEEILIADVSTIPMTIRIKEGTVRK